MAQTIKKINITVLDYETTGSVSGYPNEPWQIGLVTLKEGQVDASSMFESLLKVDSSRPFNSHAPGRHALIRNELSHAPAPSEIWKKIKERVLDKPLCAHNVGTEKKFLQRMAPLHSFGPWIDTLRLARKAWPTLSSYALDDLTRSLNLKSKIDSIIQDREAHDALYDSVASAVLLEHLLEQPGWNQLTLDSIVAL